MAKFHVTAEITIQRSVVYEVSATKAEVVERLGLEGEDRKEWRDQIDEYLSEDLEGHLEHATIIDDGSAGDTIESIEISNVDEAE